MSKDILTIDEALEKPELSNQEAVVVGKQILDEYKADQMKKGAYSGHTFLGKEVHDDWDDAGFIREMYEGFLQCVQQGREPEWDEFSTFDEWLLASLSRLKARRHELKEERSQDIIDQRVYSNALAVVEMAEGAIKRHLEKPDRQRLIGV